MTDWKHAATTAGHNEAKACQERDFWRKLFWVLFAAFVLFILAGAVK